MVPKCRFRAAGAAAAALACGFARPAFAQSFGKPASIVQNPCAPTRNPPCVVVVGAAVEFGARAELFVAWGERVLTPSGALFSAKAMRSLDAGKIFGPPVTIASFARGSDGTLGPLRLAADGAGRVYALWKRQPVHGGPAVLEFSASFDSAASFGPVLTIGEGPWCLPAAELALDAGGRIYVSWASAVGCGMGGLPIRYGGDPLFRTSADRGLPFGPPIALGPPVTQIFPTRVSVAGGAPNRAPFVWDDVVPNPSPPGGIPVVYLRSTADGGTTLSALAIVSTSAFYPSRPAVAAREDGLVVVAWNIGAAGGVSVRRSVNGGASFDPAVSLWMGSTPPFAGAPRLVLDPAGNLTLARAGIFGPSTPIEVRRSNDGGLAFGPPVFPWTFVWGPSSNSLVAADDRGRLAAVGEFLPIAGVPDPTFDLALVTSLDGTLRYGAGCGVGVPPSLDSDEPAAAGNAAFRVETTGAPPGASGALLLSKAQANAPLPGGCTLLVRLTPNAFLGAVPFATSGAGTASIPLPIPAGPVAVGVPVHMQAFLAGPFGLAATNGLSVIPW